MKILFAAETLYPPIGGADISLRTLLTKLSEEGHEITALYCGEMFDANFNLLPKKLKKYPGVWINSFLNYNKWKKVVKDKVLEQKPDLIITQEFFTAATVFGVREADKNIPIVAFVRNNAFANIHSYTYSTPGEDKGFLNKMGWKFRVQYIPYIFVVRKYRKALKECKVFSVSKYLAKELNKFKIKSKIIRPFTEVEKYKTKSVGNKILYIGPSIAKGMNIFFKIVKDMPEKEFLIVGEIPKEVEEEKYPNLEIAKWTNKMKEIYSKSRLLLVPAIYPDPCPRVVIEAGISGIPSIVSPRGGLPEETNKKQVIKDLENIDEWKEKINLMDNKKEYNQAKLNAIKTSKEFAFENQYRKFKEELKKVKFK